MTRFTFSIPTGPAARHPHKCEAAASYLWAIPLLASPVEIKNVNYTDRETVIRRVLPNQADAQYAYRYPLSFAF